MTRIEAINNLKESIVKIKNGPDSEIFLGLEMNPKDELRIKLAGLRALEDMTDEHFDAACQFSD